MKNTWYHINKKKLNLGESRASKTSYIEKMLGGNKMQIKYLLVCIMWIASQNVKSIK